MLCYKLGLVFEIIFKYDYSFPFQPYCPLKSKQHETPVGCQDHHWEFNFIFKVTFSVATFSSIYLQRFLSLLYDSTSYCCAKIFTMIWLFSLSIRLSPLYNFFFRYSLSTSHPKIRISLITSLLNISLSHFSSRSSLIFLFFPLNLCSREQ